MGRGVPEQIGASAVELRRRFDTGPMSRVQTVAVAVTVALSALDGYDVLSVTFAAPAISHDWGLGKGALGVLLSTGLAGMAIGSLALASLADVVGRRRMVLASLTLMAVGMLLSAIAPGVRELALWRVATGLGIGAMVAVINPLAAEFANARRRALALSCMTVGYPMGGVLGGLASSILLANFGWRSVFLAGSIAAALMIPVVLMLLSEPLAFLLARPRRDGLARANLLMARCRQPSIDQLPPPPLRSDAGYRAVFARGRVGTTVRITAANLLYVVMVYYLFSWLPQTLADAGFAPATASLVAATLNLAGILGGVTLGVLARSVGLKRLTVAFVGVAGLATAMLGLVPASLPVIVAVAATAGFFVFGGMSGLYATMSASFATEARASGTGFAIGVGRVGSAAAPAAAGWLFANGFDHSWVSLAFGMSALLAATLLSLRSRSSP